MNPGRFDISQCTDRTTQFTFQRTLVARGLDKLAGAKALVLLQHFKAHGIAFRQTFLGQFHTCITDPVTGNHHRAGILVDLKSNSGFFQRVDNLAGILVTKPGIEHRVVWFL